MFGFYLDSVFAEIGLATDRLSILLYMNRLLSHSFVSTSRLGVSTSMIGLRDFLLVSISACLELTIFLELCG